MVFLDLCLGVAPEVHMKAGGEMDHMMPWDQT